MDIQTVVGKLSVSALVDAAANPDLAQDVNSIINLYQTWLSFNPANPQVFIIYYNLGVSFAQLGQDAQAIHYYQLALSVKPDLHQARLNLGTCFERVGQLPHAIAQWQVVLDATVLAAKEAPEIQHRVLALNNLGRVLEGLKQYDKAEAYYTESLTLQAEQPNVIQHWVHARQRQCAWPTFAGLEHISTPTKWAYSGQLALLALTDDPMRQLSAAHEFLQVKYPQNNIQPLCKTTDRYGHAKKRIAYLSSDIANHPVSLLTVPLFELYDREQFEVYLYSWGNKDNSPVRARILSSVDHHIDADALSDEQVAQAIKAAEIDIVIDFNGLTSGARPSIFYYRAAPIQLTYLGFPGPYGHPCIDYVMVDRYLMPDALVPYFTEKPLYLPNIFQVSDDKRLVGETPTHLSCSLPENVVVLAAFNNNYKFTPEIFAVWMRVLKATPNAVLWLLADNAKAQENMRQFAACHNIEQNRLIFADRVAPADYLARYQLVDLFLDTFPFNAGTTANDALYMGAPVLTLVGNSFASRMAAALLHALDMDELITESVSEYEQRIIALANDKAALSTARNKLKQQKETTQILSSQKVVKDIEATYLSLLN